MKAWFGLILIMAMELLFIAAFPHKLENLQDKYDDDDYEDEPKRPYSFAWAAARHYNGAPDREQQEQRGEDGVTRGVYRYVDPRLRVQEVVYVADGEGFHVQASNLPQDTAAVQKARNYHEQLFDKIQEEHARIAAERELLESQENQYDDPRQRVQKVTYVDDGEGFQVQASNLPKDTVAVQKARNYHEHLFGKIQEEHARIAAERGLLESQENQYDGSRQRVQKVTYVDDGEEFHVQASNLPKDTVAVQKARNYHEQLFNRIQEEHARIAAERELLESQENQYDI